MTRENTNSYHLRLPDGWRKILKEEAYKEQRSINSVIVLAIRSAMQAKGVELELPAKK